MPRTVVNRFWTTLVGHGIVPTRMNGRQAVEPPVLDWLASDFVAHKYDLKHLIATILTSAPYQMPAVARTGEVPARDYAFRGPELRRLNAEQFADALARLRANGACDRGQLGITAAEAAAARRVHAATRILRRAASTSVSTATSRRT